MKKWNNITGFKSYLFTVSLALFLLGTLVMTNNVLASCPDQIQYECTGIETQYGEVTEIYDTCVYSCTYGFEVDLYGDWFSCYLYPINSKNLLGTANTMDGWAGCSVEFRGKSITTKLTYIQEDEGYIDIIKCKPCDNCCI
jgi:hypothetical protein